MCALCIHYLDINAVIMISSFLSSIFDISNNFVYFFTVHSLPADTEETMMADDDFDYSETDDQALSQSLDDGSQKTQGQNKSVTVTGILRENVTLKCLDNITKSK